MKDAILTLDQKVVVFKGSHEQNCTIVLSLVSEFLLSHWLGGCFRDCFRGPACNSRHSIAWKQSRRRTLRVVWWFGIPATSPTSLRTTLEFIFEKPCDVLKVVQKEPSCNETQIPEQTQLRGEKLTQSWLTFLTMLSFRSMARYWIADQLWPLMSSGMNVRGTEKQQCEKAIRPIILVRMHRVDRDSHL